MSESKLPSLTREHTSSHHPDSSGKWRNSCDHLLPPPAEAAAAGRVQDDRTDFGGGGCQDHESDEVLPHRPCEPTNTQPGQSGDLKRASRYRWISNQNLSLFEVESSQASLQVQRKQDS